MVTYTRSSQQDQSAFHQTTLTSSVGYREGQTQRQRNKDRERDRKDEKKREKR